MGGQVADRESIWVWPFELTEKIGEGGMAAVYRARYVKDDRAVAVKLLPEDMLANSAALARFQREMELLKKLRHPNVVRCFGGVCENKQPFYAMELVEGGTLDDLLRKQGRRTWRTTAECGLQMCAALAFAHAHGVVHRDVKPSNFLHDGDVIKLSDFGLAMVSSGAKLTAVDRTVGTFDYMAPEQISGKPVTPRTDLYALGGVFFEMLTGRTAFRAEQRVQILHKHLRQRPPRVSELVEDCPEDLDRLVDWLLMKKPSDRPKDAETVAIALGQILRSQPVTFPTPEKARPASGEAGTGRGRRPGAPDTVRRALSEEFDEDGNVSVETSVPSSRHRRERPASTIHLTLLIAALTICTCVLSALVVGGRDERSVGATAIEGWIVATGADVVPETRITAVRNLGQIADRSEPVVARLDELLSDADPRVRRSAIEAIATAGAAGRGSLPTLMRLEKNESHPEVRDAASEAVNRLRHSPPPSNPWWSRSLGLFGFVLVVAGLSQWPRLPRLWRRKR